MVKGWTYCTRCRRRVRAGETLDESDCLTVAESAEIRAWLKRP